VNTHPRNGGYSFTVGDSRVGALPQDIRRALVFPGANPLIKEEHGTLLWRLQLTLADQVENAVVKLYRRRGIWNRLRGGMVPFRVQREFGALCMLADGGVSCSQPMLWGWGIAPEHGHFELLVTREVPGASNLKEYLATGVPRLLSEDFLPLFDALRRMHERGVYHGALWPKNILLAKASEEAREFHLIDLARAVRFPGTICGTAMSRFDLLSLLSSLARADAGFDSEGMLRRYGYGATEARRIAAQAHCYRSSRHLRNRLALTFQLRAVAACWLHSVSK